MLLRARRATKQNEILKTHGSTKNTIRKDAVEPCPAERSATARCYGLGNLAMNSKGRRKGSLSGMLAGRIRGAPSSETKDVHSLGTGHTELHMEPVTPLFDEFVPACAATTDAAFVTFQRIEVTMEEALEVVALPEAAHANRSQSTIRAVETTKTPPRVRRPVLSRARSAPKEKRSEKDLSNMKELLKRTLSLGLQRHTSPTKRLDVVDVDNKSHFSTQPSTECGTRNESIECMAVDSMVQSSSSTRTRSRSTGCPSSSSNLAGTADALDTETTSDENTSNELDLLNVLTFIEMDAEEADWEETGVSAITAGSSSYYGDTTSSRRAVEGIPRARGFKSGGLVDVRGTPAVDGDAKTNSDLFAFLEASAIPNDTDHPPSRATDNLPSSGTARTAFEFSVVEESKEFTYEDAVVIRDETHKEAVVHSSHPRQVIGSRTEAVLEASHSSNDSVLDDRSSDIVDVKFDLGRHTNSPHRFAKKYTDKDGGTGDKVLQAEYDVVEVLYAEGTSTVTPHDVHASHTVMELHETASDIGSTTVKVECPSVAEITHSDKTGTVEVHMSLEVGIKEADVVPFSTTNVAHSDRLKKEKLNPRSGHEELKHLDENVTEEADVDDFDVPLESFELSPTGRVLDTESFTFDDDSELAVIGQTMSCASPVPVAALGSLSWESRDANALLGNIDAVSAIQPTPLSGGQVRAHSQSDFSVGSFEATLHCQDKTCEDNSTGGKETKTTESHVKLSTAKHSPHSEPLQVSHDSTTVVEDIRKTLAVNGDSALHMLSMQLHEHTNSTKGALLDESAAFTSFSWEALVDDGDSTGDDEVTQNQESKPLMPRTLPDDTFVPSASVDVTQWIEPDCEPTLDNMCASQPLEHVMTAFLDPQKRDHRSAAEEKKDDEHSLHDPARVTTLNGGAFYEKKKIASGYGKRPLYDEEFTWGFLHGMMSSGVSLLQLEPQEAASDNLEGSWQERAVTMVVEPGSSDRASVTPRLEWTTIEVNPTATRRTSSIGLIDIHSIRVDDDYGIEPDSDNRFYVASLVGCVHAFQAGSTYDRDMIVFGVRNLIAWLCFHLAAGDVTATSMLYSDGGDDDEDDDLAFDAKQNTPGKFSAFHRLRQMNHLAHAMLD